MSVLSAEDDLFDVQDEVISLTGKWRSMCSALRLRAAEEDAIASKYQSNPNYCLRAVLTKWLQKGYNYKRHGPPTWRMLVKAVAHPAGGDNVALAEEIATNHQGKLSGMSSSKQFTHIPLYDCIM